MSRDIPEHSGRAASSQATNGLLAERAYLDLRDRIVTLRLAPGAVLREDELMRELGIGRTPLREAIKALGRAPGQDPLMRFDERVHRFVWEASRNPYLVDTLDRFFALSLRVWYVVLDRVPGLATSVHDHSQLLEALLAHDAARARTLMREHVLDFQREILVAFSRR